ncbi:hypothetical protein KY284_010795 [Solanum tuberosum]|nr:hypothetical protein KY284_010795 [Solanum tuberosum]
MWENKSWGKGDGVLVAWVMILWWFGRVFLVVMQWRKEGCLGAVSMVVWVRGFGSVGRERGSFGWLFQWPLDGENGGVWVLIGVASGGFVCLVKKSKEMGSRWSWVMLVPRFPTCSSEK